MKTRILSQLYAIMKELKGCQDIIAEIQKRVPEELRNPDLIRKRATIALKNMLNDYSNFRIETIDSFFQTVLRNLAHELHLTASLTVGLNDDEVHAQAVDNVIESIQDERLPKTDRDALLQWIMDFVEEQIRNNKNWNVIGSIKDFSRNLSREFYQKNAESLKRPAVRTISGEYSHSSGHSTQRKRRKRSMGRWRNMPTALNNSKNNTTSRMIISQEKAAIPPFPISISSQRMGSLFRYAKQHTFPVEQDDRADK